MSHNRQEHFVITRDNQMSNTPFTTGQYADFKLTDQSNHIFDSYSLHIVIRNTNKGLISVNTAAMLVDRIEILKQNNIICPPITGESIFLYNNMNINDTDTTLQVSNG